ncbi:hypothetical protein MKX03_031435, partial [Papaver bracteatum]
CGLSPHLKKFDQIRNVSGPVGISGDGLLCDLLWGDLDKDFDGWGENNRGVSCTFVSDCITDFLGRPWVHDLICGAHQVKLPHLTFSVRTSYLIHSISQRCMYYHGNLENLCEYCLPR